MQELDISKFRNFKDQFIFFLCKRKQVLKREIHSSYLSIFLVTQEFDDRFPITGVLITDQPIKTIPWSTKFLSSSLPLNKKKKKKTRNDLK